MWVQILQDNAKEVIPIDAFAKIVLITIVIFGLKILLCWHKKNAGADNGSEKESI